MYSKDWVSSANGNLRMRSENMDETTGETTITIYRQDSAKFYMLKPANKTAVILSMTQLKGGTNSLLGVDIEKSVTKKIEFLGTEIIEGYECKHYLSTGTGTFQNGVQDNGCFEYWVYEPFGVTMQNKEGCGFLPVITMKNFQQGHQPDELFLIPTDYKMMTVPADGLMEMLEKSTGKSKTEMKQGVDDANRDAKSQMDKLNEINSDKNMSEQQKIQENLKMLEGLNKKK